MTKKKQYSYVLVFTSKGPKYVSEVNGNDKTCCWGGGKPYAFYDMEDAQYTALGLTLNGCHAVAVCSGYEIETQPYIYDRGHFEWVENKETK